MVAHGIEFDLDAFVELARSVGSDVQGVEVKESVGQLPKSLAETMSAFSNTSGGVVVLGLSEKNGFHPAAGFNASAIQDALGQLCSDKLEPPVRTAIETVPFEGALVVVATVPEMPPYLKPCYVKARSIYDGSFIRVGDGDRKLSRYEVDRLLEERAQPRYDREIVPDASYADLDTELVSGYLARTRAIAPRVFGRLSDEDALVCTRVLGRSEDGALRPTLAGLMALGFYPQQFFPRLEVTFAAFPGISKGDLGDGGLRFLDSKSIVGPIPIMISEALAAIRRNMRTVSHMEGIYRVDLPDYPDDAIREALANALMHRDYSPEGRGSAVQVNMFPDRLEIVNAGGLYGSVTVDQLGVYGVSATRNQYLATILEATPYTEGSVESGYVVENKGTGYAQIQRALAVAGMPVPIARDNISSFSLTLRKRGWEPEAKAPRLKARMQEGAASSREQKDEPQPKARRKRGAVQEGTIESLGTIELGLDNDQRLIVELLAIKGASKAAAIAEEIGASRTTVVRKLNNLCEKGIIQRNGRPRSPEVTYSLAG